MEIVQFRQTQQQIKISKTCCYYVVACYGKIETHEKYIYEKASREGG